jgi:hypothetical protein
MEKNFSEKTSKKKTVGVFYDILTREYLPENNKNDL